MAKLSAKTRNTLPDDAFALPEERKYPIKKLVNGKLVPDRSHAANAKSRASANATPSQKATIDRKANAVLGKPKTSAKSVSEGSRVDMRQDRAQAKRTGQTMKQVEASAQDKKRDAARVKAAKKK